MGINHIEEGIKMISNSEKYDEVFFDVFGLSPDNLNSTLLYQSITNWDSVGHMEMISRLEEVFEITIEIDDIIDFSSYDEGKKILSRYGINFDTTI